MEYLSGESLAGRLARVGRAAGARGRRHRRPDRRRADRGARPRHRSPRPQAGQRLSWCPSKGATATWSRSSILESRRRAGSCEPMDKGIFGTPRIHGARADRRPRRRRGQRERSVRAGGHRVRVADGLQPGHGQPHPGADRAARPARFGAGARAGQVQRRSVSVGHGVRGGVPRRGVAATCRRSCSRCRSCARPRLRARAPRRSRRPRWGMRVGLAAAAGLATTLFFRVEPPASVSGSAPAVSVAPPIAVPPAPPVAAPPAPSRSWRRPPRRRATPALPEDRPSASRARGSRRVHATDAAVHTRRTPAPSPQLAADEDATLPMSDTVAGAL